MAGTVRDTRAVAVLGLGRFGQRLALQLSRSGEEVLACDRDRATVEQLAPDVAQSVVLDVTDEAAMRSRGVHKVKAAVIAIGEDFEASVLCTVILKQMNVPRVIARARSSKTAEVLRRVGADDVVLAEDEAADRWAGRIVGPRVLNQIEFHEGYSIVEFEVPEAWIGKGLAELEVRRRFSLHIVAVKRPDPEAPAGVRIQVLQPAEPLLAGDVLIVMGQDQDLARLKTL